jgi:hypothetical protein
MEHLVDAQRRPFVVPAIARPEQTPFERWSNDVADYPAIQYRDD